MDNIPEYRGTLRSHLLDIPRVINQCSGIRIFGRKIRSLVFSTDVAIIKNVNADAIIAVYPFTPQPAITQAIISVADVPVFAGVGGGRRIASGADILNVSGAAKTPEIVSAIRNDFPNIPIIATGGPTDEDIQRTIDAGANAITYTPPTNGALFAKMMRDYRSRFDPKNDSVT